MTYEEAVLVLEDWLSEVPQLPPADYREAVKVGIGAMKKKTKEADPC